MLRRFIAAAFSIMLYFIIGCAGPSRTIINQENVPNFAEAKITSVTLMNGDVVIFDGNGAQYYERYGNRQRVIVGKTDRGQKVVIALDNVRNAHLDEYEIEGDTAGMFFQTILFVGIMAAVL
jgi:hypothetical protein